jgi:hypothetical protein
MTTAMPDIEHAAAKIPEKIGKGLRSQRDHVRSAMVALKYEMEHPITLAENIAYLRARLFSKALARGLRSNIPAIRQAAQDAWAVIAQNLVNNIDTNGSLQWAAQQGDPSERAKARAAIWAITHPKHRAAGGPVTRGMTYMVGERGPERFVPATDGTIVPHGGRQDVWHHLDQTAARNIVAVGGDAAGVAAILLSASQSAGARYSTPRRS